MHLLGQAQQIALSELEAHLIDDQLVPPAERRLDLGSRFQKPCSFRQAANRSMSVVSALTSCCARSSFCACTD